MDPGIFPYSTIFSTWQEKSQAMSDFPRPRALLTSITVIIKTGVIKTMKHLRYLANLEMALALAGWGVGLWGILRGNENILQYLYFFAWYPSIACLDGLLFRLRGQSWLLTQPRKFLRMFFWSVTVWALFEALNLALKNWGYVAVIPIGWVRWTGYAVAFATVLPGVLLTAQVMDALGAWKNQQARPFNPGPWQPVSLLLGIALLILPLTFPATPSP